MPRKPMTHSEQIVGRRIPPNPTYFEILMSGFVKEDGSFVGRFEPSESFMRPAHRKARKEGLIRAAGLKVGFGSGRGASLFSLTERGKKVAVAAAEICAAKRADRHVWSTDFSKAYKAAQADYIAREAEAKIGDDTSEPEL